MAEEIPFKERIKSIGFMGYKESQGLTGSGERKKWAELDLYKRARKEGSQPQSTRTKDSETALRESDRLGRPYRAEDLGGTYYPEESKRIKELTRSPLTGEGMKRNG